MSAQMRLGLAVLLDCWTVGRCFWNFFIKICMFFFFVRTHTCIYKRTRMRA